MPDQGITNFTLAHKQGAGHPFQGASVTFAIASVPSGATGQTLSVTSTTTNASGQASTVLTLGNKVGTYTVTAISAGLSGSPITFTATATAGPPTTINLTSGNNQSETITKALANPFVVAVMDVGGNPFQGASVTFAIASVPSGATGQTLSVTSTTTNASGQASTVLTLGNKVGTYTVTAISAGLSGSPITFTATATVGPAVAISLTAGNNQSGTIGALLAYPFVVTVTDIGGYAISGVSVSFAIATTPSGTTGQLLNTAITTTNASGQASTVLTLGNKVGTYTVTAISAGLSGSPITFTATATAGPPTTINLTSGNNQSSQINTALANAFVVTVTDIGSNPVQGAGVTFAIASVPSGATGQSLSATIVVTNASGQASTVLTLGNKVGTYTVTATSTGLMGSPVIFTATANPATRVEILESIPTEFQLFQNYPNPFNPTTTIEFSLPRSGYIALTIFNTLGVKIETLVSQNLMVGNYRVHWDAANVPSGIYFYRLVTGSFVETKKMVLLR